MDYVRGSVAGVGDVARASWRPFVAGALTGAAVTGLAVWLWQPASQGSTKSVQESLQDIATTLHSINDAIAGQGGAGAAGTFAGGTRTGHEDLLFESDQEAAEEEEEGEEDEVFQEATDRLILDERRRAPATAPSARRKQKPVAAEPESKESEEATETQAGQRQTIFEEIDREYESANAKKALELALQYQNELEQSVEGLWRLARSLYDKSTLTKDNKLSVLKDAQPVARRAIDEDPTCSEAHKWYAVITGAMAEHVSLNEKLECGHIFKQHVEKAIDLNPNDGLAYHLLGRWCFEVAGLSWWEKKACAALIGAPPEASYDDALQHLLKANDLKPNWALNVFFVGKCHTKLGNSSKATQWYNKCLKCEITTEEDKDAVKEARTLV